MLSYLEEQVHSWTNCVSRAINGFFVFWGEMSEISCLRSMHMSLSLSTLKVLGVRFCTSSQMLRSKDTMGCWIATFLITFHTLQIDDSVSAEIPSSSTLSVSTSETSPAFASLPAAVTSNRFFAGRRLKKIAFPSTILPFLKLVSWEFGLFLCKTHHILNCLQGPTHWKSKPSLFDFDCVPPSAWKNIPF